MKNLFNILLLSTFFLICISCKKKERYNCINGFCEEDKNGKYVSLSECEKSCSNKVEKSIFNPNLIYNEITDIDGNKYKTILINGENWMAENLRTQRYSNGDTIPNIKNNDDWANLIIGAWSYYKNDEQFNIPYGKLYNWYVVNDNRNVCPNGWHVPTELEWYNFILYLDSLEPYNNSGGKLKSIGTIQSNSGYWDEPNTSATNETGFSALPSGLRLDDGAFMTIAQSGINASGSWWSSSEDLTFGEPNAWSRLLMYTSKSTIRQSHNKGKGFSVRCKQD
jgi:uncharacterized protein (TIGR02145 family)